MQGYPIELKILNPLLGSEIPLPEHKTEGAAGVDLHACIKSTLTILPGATAFVPTGFAIHIGNPNFAAIIVPRSGLGCRKGLVLGNSVGVIDSDYQGEVKCCMWNHGPNYVKIEPGDRFAQLLLVPVVSPVSFHVVPRFTPTARGAGGFGSTDRTP